MKKLVLFGLITLLAIVGGSILFGSATTVNAQPVTIEQIVTAQGDYEDRLIKVEGTLTALYNHSLELSDTTTGLSVLVVLGPNIVTESPFLLEVGDTLAITGMVGMQDQAKHAYGHHYNYENNSDCIYDQEIKELAYEVDQTIRAFEIEAADGETWTIHTPMQGKRGTNGNQTGNGSRGSRRGSGQNSC